MLVPHLSPTRQLPRGFVAEAGLLTPARRRIFPHHGPSRTVPPTPPPAPLFQRSYCSWSDSCESYTPRPAARQTRRRDRRQAAPPLAPPPPPPPPPPPSGQSKPAAGRRAGGGQRKAEAKGGGERSEGGGNRRQHQQQPQRARKSVGSRVRRGRETERIGRAQNVPLTSGFKALCMWPVGRQTGISRVFSGAGTAVDKMHP